MNTEIQAVHYAGADAAQTRLALQMTALMTEHAEDLPHAIKERLRFAREVAAQRARTVVVAAQHAVAGVGNEAVSTATITGNAGGALLDLHTGSPDGGFGADLWTRLGSFLPLAALVLGLLSIQHFHQRSQISAAAEVDAALLGETVPFHAYNDPGFVEFLKIDGR